MPDGSPDAQFGSSGVVTLPIPSQGSAMFVQLNGKIVVDGSYVGEDAREYALLARFVGTPIPIRKVFLPMCC